MMWSLSLVTLNKINSPGPLQSVVDLIRNFDTLSWKAPFSLDLTGVDPDIVYCVEVYNITCGRSLLISVCDITEPSYTSNDIMDGYIYEYAVTPKNNMEGAENGTTTKVTGIDYVEKRA